MIALTTKDFIAKARAFHGTRFTYGKTHYTNRRTKVAIRCKTHGLFWQRPDDHCAGKGCPTCAQPFSTSDQESAWLDSRRISKSNRNKRLVINGRVYRVDAHIPKTKTIYEFYGDLWHGNPAVYEGKQWNPVNGIEFGTLYKRTMAREKRLRRAGYKIVSMWENDWKEGEQ